MSDAKPTNPPVYRVAQDLLSIDARDGCVYVVAPVGEPKGPFLISIIKLEETGERPEFMGSWPISGAIATHREAIARLHVGFELKMRPEDFDEPARSLFAEVVSGGLLRPVLRGDTQAN